jgi:cytoskeletal protein CcmA (bactofilin family)
MFGRLIKPPKTPRPAPKTVLGKKGMAPSVLAADLHILGNLIGDGVIDIDGKIDGNVRAHTVSIRANGCVRGDIIAEIVHVHGEVDGTIKAKSVSLHSTARVVGMVMHEALSIEDGAFVDGQCKRTDKIFVDAEGNELPALSADALADDEISFAPSTPDRMDDDAAVDVTILNSLRLVR